MQALHSFSWGQVYREWEIKPFPEVVFFQEGPGLRKWQWTDAGMKVINVTNILSDGTVNIQNTARFISLDEFKSKYSHFAVAAGDIVVASSGNTYGKVGRVSAQQLPLMMNTSVVRFRPLSAEYIDTEFLYAFIRSPFFKNQVESFVIGSAQPNFGPSHIKRMKIVIPPFGEQTRIGAIVSAYDRLIDNNTRRIQILEEMAQRVYEEWFVRFRFPGNNNIKMIESEVGLIPDTWGTRSATQMIQFDPRTIVPKEGIKPFVPMSSLAENSMLICNVESRAGNGGSKFKNGDTLFARITPCLENGKTGFINFLHDDTAVAFGSTEFVVLRSKTVTPEFVYLTARSERFRQHAIKSMSGATGRQRVRVDSFNEYLLVQPNKETLDKFSDLVSPLFKIIKCLAKKNQNLRQTRDLLLPKLISGEIDVSNFPEP
jgi:type I restriction enzyme, S subunit